MALVIYGPTDAYEVSTDHGSMSIVPVDVVGSNADRDVLQPCVEGTIDDVEDAIVLRERVYLARLCSGYFDCTDWTIHATEQEAEEHYRTIGEPPRSIVQTTCKYCGLDIEGTEGTRGDWRDRGNNRSCNDGKRKHTPVQS